MEEALTIVLNQIKDYAFEVSFNKESLKNLIMDESRPLGTETGPDAAQFLSSAVGHCLSASLLFCLKKARIPMKHISTTVHTNLSRNEKGRLRIHEIQVEIHAEPENEQDQERLKQCINIFEDYCIVTQSVKNGIPVNVSVDEK